MIAPKVRADSWAALLSPEQQWALFNYHYEVVHGKWELSCAWAEKEFELSRRPSRAGFYTWLEQMNKLEEIHNEEIRTIADERAKSAAAQLTVGSETMRQALTAKMMDLILVSGDLKAADIVKNIFTALSQEDTAAKALQLKGREVELKQQAQETRDEQLKLAREKFEFDAAKKAMELASEIKSVAADDSLDDDEKIQKVREALFG